MDKLVMDKPIRTGFFFGIGFSLIFVVLTLGLGLAYEYFIESIFEEVGGETAEYGVPEVLYAKQEQRGPQMVVLASVRNSSGASIQFHAEAVLLDANGELVDHCSTDRQFVLPAGETLDFKAGCPVYDSSDDEVFSRVMSAKLQFFESEY